MNLGRLQFSVGGLLKAVTWWACAFAIVNMGNRFDESHPSNPLAAIFFFAFWAAIGGGIGGLIGRSSIRWALYSVAFWMLFVTVVLLITSALPL